MVTAIPKSCQGEYIGNAIGMVPHCTVSWQITHHVGTGHSCVAVNVHEGFTLPDVFEERTIVKYIHC